MKLKEIKDLAYEHKVPVRIALELAQKAICYGLEVEDVFRDYRYSASDAYDVGRESGWCLNE